MSRRAELRILTPDGIEFRFSLAGPVARGAAVLVDMLLVTTLQTVMTTAILLLSWINLDIAIALMILGFFLLQTFYAALLEWRWDGQTVGKRLLGLRVIDAGGMRLTFPQILMRNLFRALDLLPAFYALGGVCAWLTSKRQRLGDLAAGTVVIAAPPAIDLDIVLPDAGKWNTFRAHPALEARLRRALTPDEAYLIFQALSRRETLTPDTRLALYSELAADLRARVRLPPELLEDLSDERFLLNVLDALRR